MKTLEEQLRQTTKEYILGECCCELNTLTALCAALTFVCLSAWRVEESYVRSAVEFSKKKRGKVACNTHMHTHR